MKTIPTKEQIGVARTKPSRKDYNNHGYYAAKEYLDAHFDTIDFALQFTAKVLGEPSENMVKAANSVGIVFGVGTVRWDTSKAMTAMRDQAIKEVLDGS